MGSSSVPRRPLDPLVVRAPPHGLRASPGSSGPSAPPSDANHLTLIVPSVIVASGPRLTLARDRVVSLLPELRNPNSVFYGQDPPGWSMHMVPSSLMIACDSRREWMGVCAQSLRMARTEGLICDRLSPKSSRAGGGFRRSWIMQGYQITEGPKSRLAAEACTYVTCEHTSVASVSCAPPRCGPGVMRRPRVSTEVVSKFE